MEVRDKEGNGVLFRLLKGKEEELIGFEVTSETKTAILFCRTFATAWFIGRGEVQFGSMSITLTQSIEKYLCPPKCIFPLESWDSEELAQALGDALQRSYLIRLQTDDLSARFFFLNN